MKFSLLRQFVLAAGDPFQSTNNLTTTAIGKFQMIAAGIFALVVVITGLVYSLAGAELKGKIKKKWGDVGIGAVAVFGGVMIIAFLINFVQTGGFK